MQQAGSVVDGPIDLVDPVRQLLLLDVAEQSERADDHAVLVGNRQPGDLERNRIAVRAVSLHAVIADEAGLAIGELALQDFACGFVPENRIERDAFEAGQAEHFERRPVRIANVALHVDDDDANAGSVEHFPPALSQPGEANQRVVENVATGLALGDRGRAGCHRTRHACLPGAAGALRMTIGKSIQAIVAHKSPNLTS